MRADGSDVQSLGLQDAFGPVWSPDSEWIIFQSGCSRQELLLPDISSCPEFNFDLYRVNLTDGQINTVTTMPGNEFSVAYSPDGAWVAFASTVSGSRQIYRVRPDGADLQRLTEDGHNYFPPSWVQTPNFVWQPIFLLMTALMMLSFVWWKKP
jgi:Tol biopolymer transport system component